MSNEIITTVEGRIKVFGATKTERKLSALSQASTIACGALVNASGKVGKAARIYVANRDTLRVADAASRGDYRHVAQLFAGELGEPIIVAKRADFEALPSMMEARVMKAKLLKNEGMREDKKTGMWVEGAALKEALRLHALACDLVAIAGQCVLKRAEEAMARTKSDAPKIEA